jgi:outer membrane usher protein
LASSKSRSRLGRARAGGILLLVAVWAGLQAAELAQEPEPAASADAPPAPGALSLRSRRALLERRATGLALPPAPGLAVPAVAPAAGPPEVAAEAAQVGGDPEPAAAPPVWPAPGGPPQPVVGPRRDPVEPPLIDQEVPRRWVLAVRLNGREVSQGSVFLEDPVDDRWLAAAVQLRLWRVPVDDARIVTYEGEGYYPLDAISGASFEIDRRQLTIDLAIPAGQLAPFDLDAERPPTPPPSAGAGAFLDYDVQYLAGSENQLGALVDFGMFHPLGVVTNSLRGIDLDSDPDVVRLDTTFTRDMPQRRETLRLGDSLSTGGAFAQPVRFGGVQWATNFATDPSFVTFPTPGIGGLAEQDSVVDVLVNNVRQATRNVPSGPFRIGNIPVVTGAGEVQLVVRDLLGREQLVTQPYYVSARLLREGLHDYAYELGVLRQRYGERSFDYGDALGVATHRYGFTNWATGEAHLEAEPDRQSLALGGSARVGLWGVVSGGLGGSLDEGDPGGLVQAAYEYQSSDLSVGLRTRYTTSDFAQAGTRPGRDRRTDQLNLGFDLGDFGRIGLLALNQERRDRPDTQTLTGTYSLGLGPGFLLVRAAQLFGDDDDFAVAVTYSLSLGESRSASSTVERRGGDARAGVQYRQGRGASDLGLDYRLAAAVGDDAKNLDARFGYQTRIGSGEVDVEHVDGDTNLRLGVDGSVAMVDGTARLSRRVGQAFGMVALPGFDNVRVYVDNREVGRTDSAGYLILPQLRPYEANKVRLEIEDLPLDARIAGAEAVVVPYERSGVVVDLEVRRERQAIARLIDGRGEALPPGLRLLSADGAASAWVARDGFTQIVGGDDAAAVIGDAAGRSWLCLLPPVPADTPLPDLGEIVCG